MFSFKDMDVFDPLSGADSLYEIAFTKGVYFLITLTFNSGGKGSFYGRSSNSNNILLFISNGLFVYHSIFLRIVCGQNVTQAKA